MILLIFFLSLLFLIPFVFLVVLQARKKKVFLARGMNLVLLQITLPRWIESEKNPSLEDELKIAEQFYSALAGIREHGFFKKILFGNPLFVLEISVHHIGEEIYFYIACPRSLTELIEKQILGHWPKAQIQAVQDYNIFNPAGKAVGAAASLENYPIFPLKTYQEFKSDPLEVIASVFSRLAKEGEGAAVQIFFRRSRISLKKIADKIINSIREGSRVEQAARGAYSQTTAGKFLNETGRLLFPKDKKEEIQGLAKPLKPVEIGPIQQSQISAISQKASQPLFDVNLRVVASAPIEGRAIEILTQLQTAFDQFNSPMLNQIKWKRTVGRKLKKFFYYFSFRIFNEAQSILLSSSELTTVFHFPSTTLSTPQIKWLKTKQASAPPNLPDQGIIIGKNVYQGQEKTVLMQKEDRGRHFYAIGQTGTGKSVLLQEMIRQDIEAGEGVCLIDPHGETAEKVLAVIPPSRAQDVIYFNPGEIERPIGLNMLDFDQRFPESKILVVNELIEIFEKLYNLKALGFGGPIFEQYMRNSLLLVMEDSSTGSTLIEVPRVLADSAFRKQKLARCQNIIVKNFWELEAEKAGGEAALANMVPYITSKINVFVANDLIRPIISQQQSSFNFREIMDQKKILIVNLSKGRLGDINSYLLGMIITGKLLIAAFSRSDIPEEERKDFYLYIDEFHNVTTKTIASALAEARKYHLNLVLAHQFIGQLDEETKKAIFGNVGSKLAFRVGPDDAKYLVTEFGPVFSEQDLVNLDNYNGALRLLIKGETAKPFNIVTFPPKPGNQEVKSLIKEYSRLHYGRDRDIVEAELYERLKQASAPGKA